MKYKKLGEFLLDAGAITNEELEKALKENKDTGLRLGEYLVKNKYISRFQLIETLKMQLGIDFIDLNKAIIDPGLTKYIPKNIAKKNRIVPVKKGMASLYIAMEDPLNFIAIEEAKEVSGRQIIPMIAYSEAIDRALNVLYENEGAREAMLEMQETSGLATVEDKIVAEQSSEAPTIKLVNSIIERGVIEKASDIHIEPFQDEISVRIRVDGNLTKILTIPKNLQGAVISRIKIMSEMDISEKRIPQDGRADYISEKGQKIDLRVSTLPCIFGEKVVIRILMREKENLNRKAIGISDQDLPLYRRLIKNSSGMILIAGPTGSGKTSTLYTMINEIQDDSINMISLEDPVEFKVPGVSQVAINEKTGLNFANALKACLRQDPDVICIGEIRDGETAKIALRAAMTGHLVLSTVHTEDAFTAIDRLLDLDVEPYLISASLRGVISQRLVRKICPNCKTEYTPDKSVLDLAGISLDNRKFYKGKGCPMCFDTGYKGRTGVFEILNIDSDVRNLINKGADSVDLRTAVLKKGFNPMIKNARELVINGITTVEELVHKVEILE